MPVVSPRMAIPLRARSSVGERSLHTREVAGSKPAAPITGECTKAPRTSGLSSFRGRRLLAARPAVEAFWKRPHRGEGEKSHEGRAESQLRPSARSRSIRIVGVSGSFGAARSLFMNTTTRLDPSSRWESKYHHSYVPRRLP